MMAILTWLGSLLGGPIVSGVVSAYKAKLDSQNTSDVHAVDLAKADLLAQIEARKQATILAGSRIASTIQALFAIPVLVYVWKVVIYDVVLGYGSTDAIRGDVGVWMGLIISFYMGGQVVSGVVNTIARRFGK